MNRCDATDSQQRRQRTERMKDGQAYIGRRSWTRGREPGTARRSSSGLELRLGPRWSSSATGDPEEAVRQIVEYVSDGSRQDRYGFVTVL